MCSLARSSYQPEDVHQRPAVCGLPSPAVHLQRSISSRLSVTVQQQQPFISSRLSAACIRSRPSVAAHQHPSLSSCASVFVCISATSHPQAFHFSYRIKLKLYFQILTEKAFGACSQISLSDHVLTFTTAHASLKFFFRSLSIKQKKRFVFIQKVCFSENS